MKKWNIFITFFKTLYGDHYTADSSFDKQNFTFVKVNDDYPLELDVNNFNSEIMYEHDFRVYFPELQKKGYHENSVMYHVYKNGLYRDYDYIGFIEYDHVLFDGFTRSIQDQLTQSAGDCIYAFNKFTFNQLWEQGVLLDPGRPKKETGDPRSEWNCLNVILKDYNDYFATHFDMHHLTRKNCFPICHCYLAPSAIFEKIMNFHTTVMDSGKVEQYHRKNWRARAGLMERYLAVELALQEARMIDDIQLEHRSYPIKVLKPDWFRPTLFMRLKQCLQKLT